MVDFIVDDSDSSDMNLELKSPFKDHIQIIILDCFSQLTPINGIF